MWDLVLYQCYSQHRRTFDFIVAIASSILFIACYIHHVHAMTLSLSLACQATPGFFNVARACNTEKAGCGLACEAIPLPLTL